MDIDEPEVREQYTLDNLTVLAVTNEARNTYGLRHQDYQRYRQYCTRYLYRLRKALNFTHSKGRGFQTKEVSENTLNDSRFLHLLLFDAERAWSYAMEIKGESTAGGDHQLRKRHHLVKRLRKAARIAEKLERLCSQELGRVDTRTSLDAQAYSALLSGYVLFEVQSWQAALDKFAAARTIYEKLSVAGTSHQEALCHLTIDGIDPNIRYCAYKLRLETTSGGAGNVEELVRMTIGRSKGGALLAAQVESVLSQTRQEKAATLTSISWRDRTVPLKNADLAVCILKAQEATADLDKATQEQEESTRMELFDKVLEAYGDAERVAKNALKEDADATAKVKSSKSDQNTANLNFVYTHVIYNYLSRRIQRNLALIESLRQQLDGRKGGEKERRGAAASKYPDIVKLYDNILQSLNEIKELPNMQDNLSLAQEVDSKFWYFKAWRTIYVAAAYENHQMQAEAVALLERAKAYAAQAKVALMKCNPDEHDVLVIKDKDIDGLETFVRGAKSKARAAWYLEHGTTAEADMLAKRVGELSVEEGSMIKAEGEEVALIHRLKDWPTNLSMTNPRLIDFPPLFQPIPAKPLFFDIAFSHLEYPESLAERAGRKKGAEGSRITGFFGGLWGRR